MAQPATPATPAEPAQETLAVVNGTKITRLDFDQLVQQFRPQASAWAEHNKGRVMRDLVILELLGQEAKKLQLDQDPTVRSQITIQTNNLLARLVVQKYVTERAAVTDETIRQHYEASKHDYMEEEQITASHILVKTEQEAQEVIKELKAGKDFEELAKARSLDPSGQRGSSLGTFGRGRMVPAFEAVAFALPVGEISAPVQTQFGYHVIKVTERSAAHVKPLEEVQDDIREKLLSQSVDALLDDLRNKAKVEVVNPEYQFQ
jgi:peptidyl-prolyl cis-trans isomerase C